MKGHIIRKGKIKPAKSSTYFMYIDSRTGFLDEITLEVLYRIKSAYDNNRNVIKENWSSLN